MSSRDRPKRGIGGGGAGSGDAGGTTGNSPSSSRATRSSNNGTAGAASSSSTSRPVRSTRTKATNHIVFDSDEDEDDEEEKKAPTSSSSSGGGKHRLFKSSSTNDDSSAAATSSSKSSSQKSTAGVKVDPDKLTKLESITGMSRAEAMQLLEASGNKLDVAVELYYGGGGGNGLTSSATSSSANSKSTKTSTTKSTSSGSKRTLNSDEPKGTASNIMDDGEDGVRAPIPTRSEKLLDYDPYAVSVEPQSKKIRSVFDGFRDLQEEYNESLLDANSSHSKKKQSLASLYRPPIDLLFKGTFEASKAEGCRKNKWILLNVQDQTDFGCQCLNRDLWRDDTVKEIIRANFIFVQVYFDTAEGKKLIHYYRITAYPYIAILDPRTGEKLTQFNNPAKLDQCLFCEKVTEFLGENELNVSVNEESQSSQPPQQQKSTSSSSSSSSCNDMVSVDSSSSSASITSSKLTKPLTNGTAAAAAGRAAKQTAKDVIKAMTATTQEEKSDSTSKQNGHHRKKNVDDDDDLFSADESDEEKPIRPKMTNIAKSSTSSSSSSSVQTKRETESKKVVETIKPSVVLPLSNRFETPDSNTKDCTVRILYPGGERLDFCTNGNNKFKLLVSYLSEQGFTSQTHQLIERMMPVFSSPATAVTRVPVVPSASQESAKAIASEMSNLMITNQSRNLLCQDDLSSSPHQTFRELNLFPRVLLLLQEI